MGKCTVGATSPILHESQEESFGSSKEIVSRIVFKIDQKIVTPSGLFMIQTVLDPQLNATELLLYPQLGPRIEKVENGWSGRAERSDIAVNQCLASSPSCLLLIGPSMVWKVTKSSSKWELTAWRKSRIGHASMADKRKSRQTFTRLADCQGNNTLCFLCKSF